MKKLGHTAEGPFRVVRNIKNTAYQLHIPNSRIHNVFHAGLLDKADPSTLLARNLGVKIRKKEYEVRKILGERKVKGQRQFLVSWKGYGSENDQWEPEQNVKHAKKIGEFRNKTLRKGGVSVTD